MSDPRPEIALFVTCLVDLFRPSIGFAAAALMERAGCAVVVPDGQTCCGQPAYNSGDRRTARALAARTVRLLAPYETVVVPSGSCAAMLKIHYPALLDGEAELKSAADALAAKTFELTQFLSGRDLAPGTGDDALPGEIVTYHDSCSGLRDLGVKGQPRALLDRRGGVALREMQGAEICCGFGGTFCVKYPDVAGALVGDKVAEIAASGAGTVLAGDLGCLMHIAGALSRRGVPVRARHVAEVLAGMTDGPAIGEAAG